MLIFIRVNFQNVFSFTIQLRAANAAPSNVYDKADQKRFYAPKKSKNIIYYLRLFFFSLL